jgi:hypothetical protein
MRTHRRELLSQDGAVRGEHLDLIRTGEEAVKVSTVMKLRLHGVTTGPAGDDPRANR